MHINEVSTMLHTRLQNEQGKTCDEVRGRGGGVLEDSFWDRGKGANEFIEGYSEMWLDGRSVIIEQGCVF